MPRAVIIFMNKQEYYHLYDCIGFFFSKNIFVIKLPRFPMKDKVHFLPSAEVAVE